ncbi:MAG TPA: precorrin-6Y C5,15-methyltransferase (decarboxylating) subunit CbiT [Candidatus Nitrosopolaris sp.]|nr:precorrin-6Y C5,15-methyltransferase (decarboxylating) subunit CbiT [Candidatus Nitrosopolaris sp.]
MNPMLWTYRTGGIPDELFERSDEVPITKEEIRALVISKLRLKHDSCAIDVGCGSGSITVELCLQAPGGTVYAIDFDKTAIELTKRNLFKFGVRAELILSSAQDILPSIPQADAVIIGGSSNDTARVIRLGIDRLKKRGRIVIDTILVETLYEAIRTINETQLCEIDIIQATISRAKKVKTGTMMVARNPITIISATKP